MFFLHAVINERSMCEVVRVQHGVVNTRILTTPAMMCSVHCSVVLVNCTTVWKTVIQVALVVLVQLSPR